MLHSKMWLGLLGISVGLTLAGCENTERKVAEQRAESSAANVSYTSSQKATLSILKKYDANNPYAKITHDKNHIYQDGYELPSNMRADFLKVEQSRKNVLKNSSTILQKSVTSADQKKPKVIASYLKVYLTQQPYSKKQLIQQASVKFDKDQVAKVIDQSQINFNDLAAYRVIYQYGLKDLPNKSVAKSMLKENGFTTDQINSAVNALPFSN